jgi:hypothetical protein
MRLRSCLIGFEHQQVMSYGTQICFANSLGFKRALKTDVFGIV